MAVNYALIPIETAKQMGLYGYRPQIAKKVLVNSIDLYTRGDAEKCFEEKVAEVGGEVITADKAKEWLNANK